VGHSDVQTRRPSPTTVRRINRAHIRSNPRSSGPDKRASVQECGRRPGSQLSVTGLTTLPDRILRKRASAILHDRDCRRGQLRLPAPSGLRIGKRYNPGRSGAPVPEPHARGTQRGLDSDRWTCRSTSCSPLSGVWHAASFVLAKTFTGHATERQNQAAGSHYIENSRRGDRLPSRPPACVRRRRSNRQN
jgi:hypothetical protein